MIPPRVGAEADDDLESVCQRTVWAVGGGAELLFTLEQGTGRAAIHRDFEFGQIANKTPLDKGGRSGAETPSRPKPASQRALVPARRAAQLRFPHLEGASTENWPSTRSPGSGVRKEVLMRFVERGDAIAQDVEENLTARPGATDMIQRMFGESVPSLRRGFPAAAGLGCLSVRPRARGDRYPAH